MLSRKIELLSLGLVLVVVALIFSILKHNTQTIKTVCLANLSLPDPICTPGSVISTSTELVCKLGYARNARDVSEETKKAVFDRYGISYENRQDYEIDHLISLELGGSNDISNLWPASYKIANGAQIKNQFGSYLHAQVCAGKMTLEEAQKQISTNWLKYDALRTKTITAQPKVKKSFSNICHEKGSLYYDDTFRFISYNSLDDCLASGGRLPRFK